jgi:hypothetical protein
VAHFADDERREELLLVVGCAREESAEQFTAPRG